MWQEIRSKIVSRADWVFCILLVGFILSFLSDGEGAIALRLIYLFCFIGIGTYSLCIWVAKKGVWKKILIGLKKIIIVLLLLIILMAVFVLIEYMSHP